MVVFIEDLVTKIYECESVIEAKEMLRKIYFEKAQKSEKIVMDVNTIDVISVASGVFNPDSVIKYSNGMASRYKMNMEDYIDDLVDFIKVNKIDNLNKMMKMLAKFVIKYFGIFINDNDYREDFQNNFLMQIKDDEEYFKTIENFKISDFKGKGIAQCSEFAALSQNVIALLGLESYCVFGKYKDVNHDEFHAFNIVKGKNFYLLVDTAMPHVIYDKNGDFVGAMTNICSLKDFDLEKFLNGEYPIVVPMYDGVLNKETGEIKSIDLRDGEYFSYSLKNGMKF